MNEFGVFIEEAQERPLSFPVCEDPEDAICGPEIASLPNTKLLWI